MLTQIILVNKDGSIKECKALNVTRDDLYKKCGYKKPDGFDKRVEWKVKDGEKMRIEVWAKDKGKANTENKYDFPPPIDNVLYFGTCAVILTDNKGEIKNLSVVAWNKYYETFFGGFEEINEDDDDEDEDNEDKDELTDIPKKMKTKGGYLKDGFVVDTNSDDEDIIIALDDNEDEDEENDDDDEDNNEDDDEDNEECSVSNNARGDGKDDIIKLDENDNDSEDQYDENTNSDTELEEEEYYYSDEE
jgi:hypothetical protein